MSGKTIAGFGVALLIGMSIMFAIFAFLARTDQHAANDISNIGVFLLMSFVFGLGGFIGVMSILEKQ